VVYSSLTIEEKDNFIKVMVYNYCDCEVFIDFLYWSSV